MKEIMLAIDIGTTNVKCGAFTNGIRLLGEYVAEHDTLSLGNSWFEQRPQDWWVQLKESVAGALSRAGASPSQVCQIIVSSQAPACLPVDKDGNPLRNALIWMDRRADKQSQYIREKLGNRVYEITGNLPDPYYVLSKCLWVKENEPQVYEKTHRFLMVNGYINYLLTGEFSLDQTHAALTQAYDIRKREYSREILDALDLDIEKFPHVRPAYEVAGYVTAAASRELGVPQGTQVLMGTVDASGSVLETGLRPGIGVEVTGTSSVLMLSSAVLKTDPGLTYIHGVMPGTHTPFACMSTTGAALKWFRDTLYPASGDHYRLMNEEIARDCPGPSGILFLPYMAGERSPLWDTQARGAFYGLTLGTNRAQMLRAVMEGSAYAVYDNFLAAKKTGMKIGAMRTVGGHAKSQVWNQIKASILDMPLEVMISNRGATAGLAAIGAAVRGEYASILEASDQLVQVDRIVEPVPGWGEYYREQYALFKELYHSTRNINQALFQQKLPL